MLNKFISRIHDIYYPIRRKIIDFVSPIYYRFFGHKFHIVKTGLRPQAWHDSDVRILYAVMSIVKWFVENDMQKTSETDYLREYIRIIHDNNMEGEAQGWVNQYRRQKEIEEIALWWNNYDNRLKEIDDSLTKWSQCGVMDNLHNGVFPINNLPEDKRKIERELSAIHSQLGENLHQEEQEMLKKAIELREYMWS